MTTKEKRLADGICIWCGKAPARENRQMCEQCAQRQRENVKNVRKTREAMHLCKDCGGPLRDAEGKIPMYETKYGLREYTICEKCRKRARKYEKEEEIAMAETLHEMAVRMIKGEDCQSQHGKGCKQCPADKLRGANGICMVRGIAKVDNCEEQIERLRTWAAEHPVQRYPTWDEWQHSMFPDANKKMIPCSFESRDKLGCAGLICMECRKRPIPADIAEKLGIKPIEEG